jgi:Carbohydrate binding module (family 6)
MSYCVTCKRYLNGALSCPGCGTEVGGIDEQPTMQLPVTRVGAPPVRAKSAFDRAGRPGPPQTEADAAGENHGPHSRRQVPNRALAGGGVVLALALGGALFAVAAGGPHPNSQSSRISLVAGPSGPDSVPLIVVGTTAGSTLGPSLTVTRTASTIGPSPSAGLGAGPGATPGGATPSQSSTATLGPLGLKSSGPPAGRPVTVAASQYSALNSVQLEPTGDIGGGQDVGFISNGSWLAYSGVDFGAGMSGSVRVRLASGAAGTDFGTIEFRLGSPTAPAFARVPVSGTGGWQQWTTSASAAESPVPSGTYTVYVTFSTGINNWFVNVNWFQFS